MKDKSEKNERYLTIESDDGRIKSGINRIYVGDEDQLSFRWMDTGAKDSEFPCLYYAIERIAELEQKLSEFIPKAKLVEWLKDVKNTPWVQVDWENSTKESFVKVSDLLQAIESYS